MPYCSVKPNNMALSIALLIDAVKLLELKTSEHKLGLSILGRNLTAEEKSPSAVKSSLLSAKKSVSDFGEQFSIGAKTAQGFRDGSS